MQDISLGVALGSATQIAMFVVSIPINLIQTSTILIEGTGKHFYSRLIYYVSGSVMRGCCLDYWC